LPLRGRRFRSAVSGRYPAFVNHPDPLQKEESNMQRLTLTGRLTRDPELRELPNGGSVCKLRLAVDDMAPGRETGYINVSAFGKPGEAAAKVLSTGWLVAVDGRLEYHEWEQDGKTRHDYEVIGSVEFLAAPRTTEREQPVPAAA
jgi:single stranded DNA-binding protein